MEGCSVLSTGPLNMVILKDHSLKPLPQNLSVKVCVGSGTDSSLKVAPVTGDGELV